MRLPKLRYGHLTRLAERLNAPLGTVSKWRTFRVPESRIGDVVKIVDELEEEYCEEIGNGVIVPPRIGVSALADEAGMSESTLRNWIRYGTRRENKELINDAIERMEGNQ